MMKFTEVPSASVTEKPKTRSAARHSSTGRCLRDRRSESHQANRPVCEQGDRAAALRSSFASTSSAHPCDELGRNAIFNDRESPDALIVQHHAFARAVIIARGGTIPPRELPPEVSQTLRERASNDGLDLDEQARAMIERALERFRGNRKELADALKISTVTLCDK